MLLIVLFWILVKNKNMILKTNIYKNLRLASSAVGSTAVRLFVVLVVVGAHGLLQQGLLAHGLLHHDQLAHGPLQEDLARHGGEAAQDGQRCEVAQAKLAQMWLHNL